MSNDQQQKASKVQKVDQRSQVSGTEGLSVAAQAALSEAQARKKSIELAKEINGPKGLEPTRYGDWEAKGRCYDF